MNSNEIQSLDGRKKIRYRRAILISIAVHAMAAVILLFWYLPTDVETTSGSTKASPTESALPASVAKVQNGVESSPPMPSPAADIPAEEIEASIESQISQIERLPDERKLTELEKNLKRLDQVAKPDSVQEVTATIADTLGLDDQTYQPKEAAADGPFDPSTAQIQDVIRVKSDTGRWDYESVLVDAEGRTANVAMSRADGQTTYDTFQQMKKFPMAEGIYRSLVMPMMQKMIEAEEIAKRAAVQAERAKERTDEP